MVSCAVLARVTGGHECQGQLTPWGEEEQVLHQYHGYAADCHSLKCAAMVVLQPAQLQRHCGAGMRACSKVALEAVPMETLCVGLRVSDSVFETRVMCDREWWRS